MKKIQRQLGLAAVGGDGLCGRCGAPCAVTPVPGSQAKMLKRSSTPKGLCINCAVHDQLRHLYPANLMLERSKGQGLSLPHIQKMFFGLCQMAGTDAQLEEINWPAIVANWDLPFPHKLRSTAMNPVRQEDMDEAAKEGRQRRSGEWKAPLTPQEQRAKDQAAKDAAERETKQDNGV